VNKLAVIQKRGDYLARRIFAALPFSVRLAYVFSVLANTDLQALGRALGVIFIKKRVEGLPEIHGKPALDFPVAELEAQHKDPSRLIPSDYLKGFSEAIRQKLFQRFHSEQLVDTVISNWLFRFIVEGGWQHMKDGLSLATARNYALHSMENQALNEIKVLKRDRDRSKSIQETDEEGHQKIDPADPTAPAKFYDSLPTSKLPAVRRVLEQKVHPDAPLYLDLLLEGYNASEILGHGGQDTMLPHLKEEGLAAPYANWKKNYEPKIRQVLERFMAQAV
jgi:hypothetical protein